jgi:hypothetical protein
LYWLIKWTGQFTDNKIATFPYTLASKDNQTIFDPHCVPEGFVLSDPDHLHGSQIISLYNHWLHRQEQNLSPFVVLKAGPLHRGSDGLSAKAKGKRKVDYVEEQSEDEEVKSMGDDEQGDPSEHEADFGAKVISTGVRVGPPNGKIAGSSKQGSKGQDHPQLPGTSSFPSKTKSIKEKAQQDGNEAAARKKILPSKKAEKSDTKANDTQAERSKTGKSAKDAKSAKRKAEDDLEPGPAKSSKSDAARKSGRRAEEAPAPEPLAVSNPTATEGQTN